MAHKQDMLRRPGHPMPAFVREALEEAGLMAAYEARPAYQRAMQKGDPGMALLLT